MLAMIQLSPWPLDEEYHLRYLSLEMWKQPYLRLVLG